MARKLLDAWMNGPGHDDPNGIEHCALGTIMDWGGHIRQHLCAHPASKFSGKRSVGHGVLSLDGGDAILLHNVGKIQVMRGHDAIQA